jgi:NADH:ubiquinone oxidoreductase subunit E
MNEWADGSMINDDAIDKLTEAQVRELLDLLSDI